MCLRREHFAHVSSVFSRISNSVLGVITINFSKDKHIAPPPPPLSLPRLYKLFCIYLFLLFAWWGSLFSLSRARAHTRSRFPSLSSCTNFIPFSRFVLLGKLYAAGTINPIRSLPPSPSRVSESLFCVLGYVWIITRGSVLFLSMSRCIVSAHVHTTE